MRRFFIENIERDNLQIDTQYFGKFSIVADPDADFDALYPRKLEFEPSGPLLSSNTSIQKTIESQSMVVKVARPLDMARLTRLAHFGN